MSQVTISLSPLRVGRKIRGLNIAGTKTMRVEKFNSRTVTRTTHVGRIVTRTEYGRLNIKGILCRTIRVGSCYVIAIGGH